MYYGQEPSTIVRITQVLKLIMYDVRMYDVYAYVFL